ncbi:NAD(P)-dependent oxidoreductase [Rhodobacteraceae bacterium F11138]|nr:NAD(P)-dependent oxidoreductase [Rhodobacteraceae bacterium F11138]
MHFPEVLVLGATGRLGGILRGCWPRQGPRWQSRRARAGAGWCVFDPLGDPEALARAARGCDAILCLAGGVPGRGRLADTVPLAEAAVRAGAAVGARVLLASSAAVYGAAGGVMREDMVPVPVSDYGRVKRAMEHTAAVLGAELGVPVSCLRIGNVAGVDAILGGWHAGFGLDRFADGRTPRRSYIGPATLARVLGDLLAAPDLPEVLNVAAPGAIGMGALLDAADLGWTPRVPEDSAIPEVRLSTETLERFTAFAPAESTAAEMVAQWCALKAMESG